MQYAWACCVCIALSCGGSVPETRATSPGPGPWRELTSEHFTIWTDASPERARVLVPTMETLRQVVLGVSGFTETKGKSFVIAFDSLDEIHQYVAPQFIGKAWSGYSLLRQPVIVIAAESLAHDRRIVTHELTHSITYNVMANQPGWFAEGIAGYFETVRLDEGHANLDIGIPLEGRIDVLHRQGFTPIAQLFACDREACKDGRFYATTWALYTYLLNEHPAELTRYSQRLAATPLGSEPPSWVSVVPSLPPDALERELVGWLQDGHIRVLRYNIQLRQWTATERPIAEADAFAAKGLLRYLTARHAVASPEVARALQLDPTNVLANMIRLAGEAKVPQELARSLTTAHPADWRAWYLAWRAAPTRAESREARAKTCALIAANPVAVPIADCSRPEDTRNDVFRAALPQLNGCMRLSKVKGLAETFSVDVDLDAGGGVSDVRVQIGSSATNACFEEILKGLTWPAGYPGTFHTSTHGPKR